ncbi:MAG TPA: hypothetical protein VK167_13375 [Flavipsychrobacter sp.]|nr:hypothetical protein [Flavipsychrobacter sp.]
MKYLIVITFLFLAGNIYAQKNGRDILQQVANTMRSKQSLSYDIAYFIKSAGASDTSKLTAHVDMLRVAKDTLMGGMVWLSPVGKAAGLVYAPGTFMFYDLKYAYKVRSEYKKVLYQDPHITKPVFMFEVLPECMVWKPFMKTNEIKKLAGSDYSISMLNDTVINKRNCYSIMIKSVKTPIEHWLWHVNKRDYMLVDWEEWVIDDSGTQYEHFTIKSYQFDNVKDERFSTAQLPADYERVEIQP